MDSEQKPKSEGELLQRDLGDLDVCSSNPNVFCETGMITNLTITSSNPSGPVPPPYDTTYGLYITFSWNPLPNATSYTITTDDTPGNSLVIYTEGTTNATLYFNPVLPYITVTVTAVTPCGNTSSAVDALPCFLAGSLVWMSGMTTKAIENVQVGDKVIGAFGEINTVLALHRPLLGDALMCKINEQHHTTNHHPHIALDRRIYSGNPALTQSACYNQVHQVIDASGNLVDRMLEGLVAGRVQLMTLGIALKTIEGGRVLNIMDTYNLPPETQLYNLVLDGSHTYYVDDYAVTGWPNEDDFNYDTWTPITPDANGVLPVRVKPTFDIDVSGNLLAVTVATKKVLSYVSGSKPVLEGPTGLSGAVVDVSGTVVDVSGAVVDVSGAVVDVSGAVVDVSGAVVDVSGAVVDVSGAVVDVSGGQPVV